MDLQVQFGTNLRMQRLSQAMSQEALAYDADIAMNYLSGIERGTRNPSLQIIERLANALRIPVANLFMPVTAHDGIPSRLKPGRRPTNFVRKKRSSGKRRR
jgi:transcriptional regulator with XRE-family HTH domain